MENQSDTPTTHDIIGAWEEIQSIRPRDVSYKTRYTQRPVTVTRQDNNPLGRWVFAGPLLLSTDLTSAELDETKLLLTCPTTTAVLEFVSKRFGGRVWSKAKPKVSNLRDYVEGRRLTIDLVVVLDVNPYVFCIVGRNEQLLLRVGPYQFEIAAEGLIDRLLSEEWREQEQAVRELVTPELADAILEAGGSTKIHNLNRLRNAAEVPVWVHPDDDSRYFDEPYWGRPVNS